jgi:hypothetical protein
MRTTVHSIKESSVHPRQHLPPVRASSKRQRYVRTKDEGSVAEYFKQCMRGLENDTVVCREARFIGADDSKITYMLSEVLRAVHQT